MSRKEKAKKFNLTKEFRSTKQYIAQSLQTLAYAKRIKKCPPPLFCITIAIIQITVFILSSFEVKGFDGLTPVEVYLDFNW